MYEYRVRRVHRVVDGDTYDLEIDLGFYQFGVYRVRLLGVDTPEVYGRNASEEGRAASQYVKTWFGHHMSKEHTIYIHTTKSDSFGRWLADVFVIEDGVSRGLGEELIEKGYAEPYRR